MSDEPQERYIAMSRTLAMPPAELATVCRREVVNADGAGTIWYVRLYDGYLIDCGYGYGADARAADIARRLNLSYAGDNYDVS